MVGVEQYAHLLGHIAAFEKIIGFMLARDDVRTGDDVLGVLDALKNQTLSAAAQAAAQGEEVESLKSFLRAVEQGFDGMRRSTEELRTMFGTDGY